MTLPWLVIAASIIGSSMIGALGAEAVKRFMNRAVDPILDNLSRNRRDHLALKRTLEELGREFPANGESLPAQMTRLRRQIDCLQGLLRDHLEHIDNNRSQ
ncbi:MAG: hypothetical protein GY926_06275 [bacterium]|nr:hypothetical protein [bacterium]